MQEYLERKARSAGPLLTLDSPSTERFRLLLQAVHTFFENPQPEVLETIEAQIATAELAMMRSSVMSQRVEKESETEKQRLRKHREEKEFIEHQEVVLRQELVKAKQLRKKIQEYQKLMKEINKLPPRVRALEDIDRFRTDELQPAEDRQKKLRIMLNEYRAHVNLLSGVMNRVESVSEDAGFTVSNKTRNGGTESSKRSSCKRGSSSRSRKSKVDDEKDRKRRYDSRYRSDSTCFREKRARRSAPCDVNANSYYK
ncbi:hypothetical protein QR680_012339 [Steinernema hermaphroditum]|uniref:Uncharacterized protein n=1 Tax=Steinernema hermaphroditum TaxID=289476 RepID=A0AA39I4H1_9BILA|nr:hypothetical protein QR680_012339 [Steinernema hermaphroditum]